jgi:hypothetical protein
LNLLATGTARERCTAGRSKLKDMLELMLEAMDMLIVEKAH